MENVEKSIALGLGMQFCWATCKGGGPLLCFHFPSPNQKVVLDTEGDGLGSPSKRKADEGGFFGCLPWIITAFLLAFLRSPTHVTLDPPNTATSPYLQFFASRKDFGHMLGSPFYMQHPRLPCFQFLTLHGVSSLERPWDLRMMKRQNRLYSPTFSILPTVLKLDICDLVDVNAYMHHDFIWLWSMEHDNTPSDLWEFTVQMCWQGLMEAHQLMYTTEYSRWQK